jgi:hypothetical protein
MATALAPIVHEYHLDTDPERAFEVYTTRIGRWWDPRYSANPATFNTVTIEPRVGGRIYATHSDLGRHDWGEVTVWEPGQRFVHTFVLAQDPADPSQVAARFAADGHGRGCSFRFEHGGWRTSNATARVRFGDWPLLLDRYAALATGPP